MPRFLKTRHAITVFKNHTPHAPIVATVAAGEVVPYNREKLRHGIRWIEVFMADGTLGYVRKNSNDFFICLRVKLNDHLAQGFDFATQVDDGRKVNDLFLPVSPIDGSAALSGQGLQARVELRRIEDSEKKKTETLVLAYDPAVTTVAAFAIEENEEFYVVYASGVKKDSLIEIDNLVDKRGYLLASTSYIEVANQWIYQIGVVVMMLVVLCIVIACFAAGWIVMGAILIIPGIILGFASIVVLQLVSMLIKAMVHEIRVRL